MDQRQTIASNSAADSRRSLTLSLLGVTTVAVLVGISAYAQRSDLQSTGQLLTQSKRGWLAVVLGLALLSLASVCAMHTAAQRAAGLRPTYLSLLRPTLRGHMLNLVTKSNGLAGLVAFTRHGRQNNSAHGAVLGAYLLTTVVQQLGFSLVVSIVFAVLIFSGQFTTGYLVAGFAFVVYVAFNLTLFVAATRSQATLRSIYRRIGKLNPWRNQKVGEADYGSADELFEAAQLIRTNPRGAAKVLAPTIVFDLALAGILAASLKAVGADAPVVVALIAFAISTLVGIISFLPAGLGFVEVSSVAVLVASGVDPKRAAAATALYRLTQLWLPILLGVAAGGGRVRPIWWRPLRASAAGLAALTGVVVMISAAGDASNESITVASSVVGVSRSDQFATALSAVVMFSLGAALWRGKRWGAILAPLVGLAAVYAAPSERGDIAIALVAMTLVLLLGAEAFRVPFSDKHDQSSGRLRRNPL